MGTYFVPRQPVTVREHITVGTAGCQHDYTVRGPRTFRTKTCVKCGRSVTTVIRHNR